MKISKCLTAPNFDKFQIAVTKLGLRGHFNMGITCFKLK